MELVADPEVADALADASDAIDRLFHLGVVPSGVDDAYALIRGVNRLERRVRALEVAVLGEVHRGGWHRADGHGSAKVMVRAAANLSGPDAFRLERAAKAAAALPVVAEAFCQGLIGVGQVERIGRTFANKRVAAKLIQVDAHVAVLAARLPYGELDQRLADWERTEDEDGPGDRAARAHRNRNGRMDQGFDGGWDLLGKFGSLQGVEVDEIYSHFIEAERLTDWAEARARLGDAATAGDLCRTEPQRRADALHAVFLAAASAFANAPGGSIIVANIVMDLTTFERKLTRLAGADPGPDDRAEDDLADEAATLEPLHLGLDHDGSDDPAPGEDGPGHGPDPVQPDPDGDDPGFGTDADAEADGPDLGPDPAADEPEPDASEEFDPWAPLPEPFPASRTRFACRTLDGKAVDPAEATAHALLGHVRRVVVGSNGVVLDMGRRTRLFTGLRQLAVRLPELTCTHPGCNVPVNATQSDHLDAYNGPRQGRTDPGNGGPTCGKHNRFKHTHRITPRRDEHGRWHYHRPDGTEIPQPGSEH